MERERGVGSGKVVELGFKLKTPCMLVRCPCDISGNMATGGHGIVISVLAFVIVCNLCPSSETFSDNKRCFNVLSEERCDVVSIGYGQNIIFPYYIYTRPGSRSQNTTPTVEKSLSYACYCQATFTLVQVLMGKFVPALTKVEFWILDRTWLNGTPLLYRYECQAVTGLQILTAWLIIYPNILLYNNNNSHR